MLGKLSLMEKDDNKYFETYLDLFIHPGWKQFVEEMTETRDSYNLDFCKDYDAFMIMKSAREQLNRIITFEQQIRLVMETKESEDEGAPNTRA